MRVHSLHTYPLKGAGGTVHDRVAVALEGLADDRRWMIVDADGTFVSQREVAKLALLRVVGEEGGIRLRVPAAQEMFVRKPDGARRLPVTIWSDMVEAALCTGEVNALLSRWLGQDVRLVFFDDGAGRSVSRDWVDRDTPVGFADGFPLLVTNTASLAELNRRMVETGGEAVPMDRFRPNLVIEGAEPFAEDGWQSVAIAGVVYDFVNPCARCIVTTIDQESGTRTGKEPLRTLARTRRSADPRAPGALFGWNVVPRSKGHVHVGDAVEIVSRRQAPWPIA